MDAETRARLNALEAFDAAPPEGKLRMVFLGILGLAELLSEGFIEDEDDFPEIEGNA